MNRRQWVLVLAAPAVLGATAQAQGVVYRWARVTYVTSMSVYVSAGTAEGLAEGSQLEVVRGGALRASLQVAFVSTHQVSCRILSATATVAVGDSVRFVPRGDLPPVDSSALAGRAGAAPPLIRPEPAHSTGGRLRGRVGLYYLSVQEQNAFGGRFAEPSAEIRLSGARLAGSPFGLVLDLRSRRIAQALPSTPNTTTDQTRVYQGLIAWQPTGSSWRATAGRQYAPGITSVGLIDGAAVERGATSWDYGVFAGSTPDPITLRLPGDSLLQLGVYVRRHSPAAAGSRWAFTTGASGSYLAAGLHTNREFVYAQGTFQTRKVYAYAVQEVDYYRPWRRQTTGEPALSPTSTFAAVQLNLTEAVALSTGIDNRRNVRTYEDVINPAALFDDTFRRGVWAGASARVASHYEVNVDVRANHDATTGEANTYTVALDANRFTRFELSARTRTTRYTVGTRQGWLQAFSLGLNPMSRASLQFTSGWRTERDSNGDPGLDVRWVSLDTDITVMRTVFFSLSGYRERGGVEAHDLLYAGISYRF